MKIPNLYLYGKICRKLSTYFSNYGILIAVETFILIWESTEKNVGFK